MTPASLTAADFATFFHELWNYDPFPWQREFARRLCAGRVPDYVAAPTGSGKTACLDAAVFALATQANAPTEERTQGRRIFFIVNRRVIVDEAYDRAGTLCKKLKHAAPDSVTGRVAAALRKLSGDSEAAPLTRVQLRGGIYRDRSWAGSLVQPMIVCSTVDQAGSRLLFRGYGVRPQARPIHAALVAQDSLLIIDEAHISRPFLQTLEWVRRYRRHQPAGCETVQLPFQFIRMTATPPVSAREDQKIALTPDDHEHPVLKPRLRGSKPARLVVESKAKGKARNEQMTERLLKEAESILSETDNPPRSIAVMVNRVATARSVAARLEQQHKGRVTLLIGRMRPIDREAATQQIQERLKTGARPEDSQAGPLIIVSTQCLEVGADLDFDALVTEAASLDALRQRFGRLNRGGREITPRAVIVLPGDQDLDVHKLDDKAPADAIYGNAIARTWHWLSTLAQDGIVDFGINAMNAAVDALRTRDGEDALATLLSPTTNAPILLPAYLDCWVQTNPAPAADPDVTLFLHGPQREMTDVQVCWRGDLPSSAVKNEWSDILSLCPPTTAECLPVPLHVFRAWLDSTGEFKDDSSDAIEWVESAERKRDEDGRDITAFVWRGPDDCLFTQSGTDVRPGDTLVLRVQGGGWQALGYIPGAPDDPQSTPAGKFRSEEVRFVDVAEKAAASARRRAIIRIHPALWPAPEEGTVATELMQTAMDEEQDWHPSEIKELLEHLLHAENPGWPLTDEQCGIIQHLTKRRGLSTPEPYPDGQGFVLSSRELLPLRGTDGDEEIEAEALLEAAELQELRSHTNDVLACLENALAPLPLTAWREALVAAAAAHDWGKVDPRFQALLRGTSPFAAMASETFLAKSGSLPSSAAARRAARERAELPEGFRHEMLSVQMAESEAGATLLPEQPILRSLALHLIATHHGYARPFAPLVDDNSPPDVNLSINDKIITITETERLERPAYALDAGFVERFWQMTHHYGWWGLALLESVLRLADQTASANPHPKIVKP